MTTRERPRADADGRREQLLEATRRVVVREGVAATTTRRIATEAGVPLGTVHYWFASKDALLEVLALDHVGRVEAAAVEAMATGTASAADGLRAAMEREQTYSDEEQLVVYELAIWALRTPGREDLARRLYAAIREAAERACGPWLTAHGATIGPSAAAVPSLIAALFDGLALARLADPAGTPTTDVLELLGRLLDLLAGRTG